MMDTKRKQGRSSCLGANILSFVLRQLTDDFKEEKESANIENQSLILLNNNLKLILGSPKKGFLVPSQ